jgi:hypothetical protein
MGFYKPILLYLFLIPGVLFIYLTRIMRDSRMWNIFMWFMLIVGHGVLVALYSRSWYFNYYVENYKPEWWEYFWIL